MRLMMKLFPLVVQLIVELRFLKMYLFSFYACKGSACMYVCAPHVCLVLKEASEGTESLNLKLKTAVSSHVGAGHISLGLTLCSKLMLFIDMLVHLPGGPCARLSKFPKCIQGQICRLLTVIFKAQKSHNNPVYAVIMSEREFSSEK